MSLFTKEPCVSQVVESWENELREHGYEPPSVTWVLRLKFAVLSRVWRRIMRCVRISPSTPAKLLEFGCGGGAQIIPIAVNRRWQCVGIDCSEEVLARAEAYLDRIVSSNICLKGTVKLVRADFLDCTPQDGPFDITVQFGVLEHYLNSSERLPYLQKMFELTKPGGFVVSAVPNGGHVLRRRQRLEGLGGYKIPEIDYSDKLLAEEMISCGANSVKVLFHDLFGYLKLYGSSKPLKALLTGLWFLLQAPFLQALPVSARRKHAYWLIAIGRK